MWLWKNHKTIWLDLYRVMLSNSMAAHNSFADSLSNFLWQYFLWLLAWQRLFGSGVCWGTLFLVLLFPCFPGMNSIWHHFLFPLSLLTLIHEDEWLSWLLVQVDSNIHSFTFFYWEGWMFQFTAPFAYSSSVCSRVPCSQREHIIFSHSHDNLLKPTKTPVYSAKSIYINVTFTL